MGAGTAFEFIVVVEFVGILLNSTIFNTILLWATLAAGFYDGKQGVRLNTARNVRVRVAYR